MYEHIKTNWENIQIRVASAARKTGRKPEEISIVAVSKLFPEEAIRAAIESGITDFGESRIQEAEKKINAIGNQARWYLIGHLQTNKAKKAVGLFDMIQSIDSFILAQLIDEFSRQSGKTIDCLLEINSSGEKSKFGLEPTEALIMIERVAELKNINLSGLMTVGPLTDDEAQLRKSFSLTADLFRKGRQLVGDNFRFLSMGMTSDFEIAIDERSNMIRIGTGIFGERK